MPGRKTKGGGRGGRTAEKKILSFPNNCKGQECATVAFRETQRCVPRRRARLSSPVPGGRPGNRSGHLLSTHRAQAFPPRHNFFPTLAVVLVVASWPPKGRARPRAEPRPRCAPSLRAPAPRQKAPLKGAFRSAHCAAGHCPRSPRTGAEEGAF